MASKEKKLRVVMLPWLAHGHISPFLELAKRLAHRNFHIYLCSTPINLKPFRQNYYYLSSSSIQFVDLHLPSSSNLPPHFHTTKGLPPRLMTALKLAFDASESAFSDILKSLKPDLLIYDCLQPWAPAAAAKQSVVSVVFPTIGPASSAFLTHFFKDPALNYPFPAFDFSEVRRREIAEYYYDTWNGSTLEEKTRECIQRSCDFVLVRNTSEEIEDKHMEYFSTLIQKKVVPVGPLVQAADGISADSDTDAAIMEWLSDKDPASSVFVSFGSEYFLSKEQREEIARGLELSGVNFIWVVRFHGGEEKISLPAALPEGFEERIGEKGMVVEGWAPQAKILSHRSIGGFVSHCGWSSTLEAMAMGVPIIAVPMDYDQPLNAKLAADMGVGVEVRREKGRDMSEELGRVIRDVVAGEVGGNVRRKAKEISEKMRERGDRDFDLTVEKLVDLVAGNIGGGGGGK